jgi:hypothetical protein
MKRTAALKKPMVGFAQVPVEVVKRLIAQRETDGRVGADPVKPRPRARARAAARRPGAIGSRR